MTHTIDTNDRPARSIADIKPSQISRLMVEVEWRQTLIHIVTAQLPEHLIPHCDILAPSRSKVILKTNKASWATHLRGLCNDIRFALARETAFASVESVGIRVCPRVKSRTKQKRQLPSCRPISDMSRTIIGGAAARVTHPALQAALANLSHQSN